MSSSGVPSSTSAMEYSSSSANQAKGHGHGHNAGPAHNRAEGRSSPNGSDSSKFLSDADSSFGSYSDNSPHGGDNSTPIKKKSSPAIVFSMATTMSGSALLALPYNYAKSGLVGGPIVALIAMILCTIPAHLEIRDYKLFCALKQNMTDYAAIGALFWGEWMILLGRYASVIVLLGALISYFIYITHILSLVFGLIWSGEDVADAVYFCCACAVLVINWGMSRIRNMGKLITLANFGFIAIAILLAYIIYWGVTTPTSDEDGTNFPSCPWDSNIFNPLFALKFCGVCTMNYFVHNLILGFMGETKNLNHGQRDATFAFACAMIINMLSGICGSLPVRCSQNPPQDISEVFPEDDPLSYVALGFLLLDLILVDPILLQCVATSIEGIIIVHRDQCRSTKNKRKSLRDESLAGLGDDETMADSIRDEGSQVPILGHNHEDSFEFKNHDIGESNESSQTSEIQIKDKEVTSEDLLTSGGSLAFSQQQSDQLGDGLSDVEHKKDQHRTTRNNDQEALGHKRREGNTEIGSEAKLREWPYFNADVGHFVKYPQFLRANSGTQNKTLPSWVNMIICFFLEFAGFACAMWYPEVSSILGLTGSIGGGIYIFFIPLMTHWKVQEMRYRLEEQSQSSEETQKKKRTQNASEHGDYNNGEDVVQSPKSSKTPKWALWKKILAGLLLAYAIVVIIIQFIPIS